MMCTVCHWRHSGARFAFNGYKHSVQLIVRHPGQVYPEALMRKEGVTHPTPPLHGTLWDEPVCTGG